MQGDKMKLITQHGAMIYFDLKKSIEGMQNTKYCTYHWLPRFYKFCLQHFVKAADDI